MHTFKNWLAALWQMLNGSRSSDFPSRTKEESPRQPPFRAKAESLLTSSFVENTATRFTIPPTATIKRLRMPEVRAEARRCIDLIGANPTPDQWDMILADGESAQVVAGAGSGKSTTLVLRILVFHKILGIPLEQMHVFSFTRDSIRDFRSKLASKIATWEERVEGIEVGPERLAVLKKASERTVTTFHSAMWQLRRQLLPNCHPDSKVFSFLGPATRDEGGTANPMVSATLSPEQLSFLQRAHSLAYAESKPYRMALAQLIDIESRKQWLSSVHRNDLQSEKRLNIWMNMLDQEKQYHGLDKNGRFAPSESFPDRTGLRHTDPYRVAVSNCLTGFDVEYIALAEFKICCPIPGGIEGRFWAAFRVRDLWIHVDREISGKLFFHQRDRKKFVIVHSGDPERHRFLEVSDFHQDSDGSLKLTDDAVMRLHQWLTLQGFALSADSARTPLIKLLGDISEKDLTSVLYHEGCFVESLGIEVTDLPSPPSDLEQVSALVAQLLPPFWQAFERVLAEAGIIRYHHLLSALRDESKLAKMLPQLECFTNLFVDEFQDISPEMVDWLAKMCRCHAGSSASPVSVTAIGDDYQSIYAWRGTHPAFLIDYRTHFDAVDYRSVLLRDNFRSRQPIVNASEALLKGVENQITKHGESFLADEEYCLSVHPVSLVDVAPTWGQTKADVWRQFATFVVQIIADIESQDLGNKFFKTSELEIFVLARRNASLQHAKSNTRNLGIEMQRLLTAHGIDRFTNARISPKTFHGAKGLEADFVLMLEDCTMPPTHPLRDFVFTLSDLPSTYTQTIEEEARRLAYVAMTRARTGVLWVNALDDGKKTPFSPSAQGGYTIVNRYLQNLPSARIL
jgi:superfamily I DNA/RNA helicase